MELKNWNRGLLGLVSLILLIALLVLVKLLFAGNKDFEWGSVSDWVSALANVGMFGAALYAALIARDWLLQKKTINTLDSAHQLALQFDQKLWSINTRLYMDVMCRTKIKDFIINKLIPPDDIFLAIQSKINKNTSTDLSELADIYNTLSALGRFKITIKDSHSEMIGRILSLRKDYLNSHYDYLSLLSSNMNCIDCDEVTKAENIMNSNKKELANIFQNNLAKKSIDDDYSFW